MPTKVIALMGPTAAGKTGLAIEIARRFAGEIIGADSMQIYKYMVIGAAAPSRDELTRVPHHLIGVIEPSQPFTVADWVERATGAIRDISGRGLTPILAGGTGLYFRALFDGLFEAPEPDPEIRLKLKERARKENLYPELERIDPAAARKIHPNDTYRITRALEVYYQTGIPISEHWRKQQPSEELDALRIGLDLPRAELHQRINDRAQRMIEAGLIEEVKELRKKGYKRDIWPMRHFGYRYVWAYLEGEIELDQALQLLSRDTRRYARRQLTWFRAIPGIRWFNAMSDTAARMDEVKKFIEGEK